MWQSNFSLKTLCAILPAVLLAFTTSAADPLEQGFLNPPESAKPRTWWHWMNSHVSKEGITADLESMKQIGLAGATVFNVDSSIPAGPVKFMSPEWREHFKFAVEEANRLGLKLSVANAAGWSSSGGPWNTVTNAMQRLTSSELTVIGPTNFDASLPTPPINRDFYRDIGVLAFQAPSEKLNSDSGGSGNSLQNLQIRSATYEGQFNGGSADVTARLNELLKSGRTSVIINNDEMGENPAPFSSKQLRIDLALNGESVTVLIGEGDTLKFPANLNELAALRSFDTTLVGRTFVRPPAATLPSKNRSLPLSSIVNLTTNLTADGRLQWQVPPGKWIIQRFGYTPIGVFNHPAPAEGAGLECDKLSKTGLNGHWNGFMAKILEDIGPLAGKTLVASLIDSYEIGNQDWTVEFREEFQKRRGYDPLPYLPVFDRYVIENPAVTERFLWDMRKTVADLFTENYFAQFETLCKQHGLISEIEPYTGPFESLKSGAPADVVMAEFWVGSQGDPSIKPVVSLAHIYGKSVVAAESFTGWPNDGRWQSDPWFLKPLGDLIFSQGINRYVFHRFAMQPWTNRWPGMTMGPFGMNFERTLTWWDQGKAWIDYISRSQFLLQQGRAVADAAYFSGQSAPSTMRAGDPALPPGYDFDAVNEDVLLNGSKISNGRLTLASGANYAILILPPSDINMTPTLMRRIRELVRDGLTVVGPRPQRSPSLQDYPHCDTEVRRIADELWGDCDGRVVLENAFGKGRIIWGRSIEQLFAEMKLKPDFEYARESKDTQLVYTHRTEAPGDIYFVSNQRRQPDTVSCTFRVQGRIPELWHADTGRRETAPVWSVRNGRTTVQLNLEPAGSVFVIFRRPAGEVDQVVSAKTTSASPAAPQLKISRAIYTAIDGAGQRDVTREVAGEVRNGTLTMAVRNEALGGDPAAMHPKELRVEYSLDGAPGRATARENETLAIPPAGMGLFQESQILIGSNGFPFVRFWRNEQLEFTTARGNVLRAKAANLPAPSDLSENWNLRFPPNWGAPSAVTLDRLISWTDHGDAGVRYFSGTATYEKEIEISADRLNAGRELWLDLGTVKNFAEVSLNGIEFGVLWKPPFRLNITEAAKPGRNKLVIKVTNLWPNRIIGDEQLPADSEWKGEELREIPQWVIAGKPSPTGRFTFATWRHYSKDSPLLESGLLGPVTLRSAAIVPAR